MVSFVFELHRDNLISSYGRNYQPGIWKVLLLQRVTVCKTDNTVGNEEGARSMGD